MNDDTAKSVTVVQHYIKSAQCVDVPMHGVFGGLNPETGAGYMAIFAERPPIPTEVRADLGLSTIGGVKEVERIGKEGMIRSVNAVVYFDINGALALQRWLNDRINGFRQSHPHLFPPESPKA